jgi:hypothetical protein
MMMMMMMMMTHTLCPQQNCMRFMMTSILLSKSVCSYENEHEYQRNQ